MPHGHAAFRSNLDQLSPLVLVLVLVLVLLLLLLLVLLVLVLVLVLAPEVFPPRHATASPRSEAQNQCANPP